MVARKFRLLIFLSGVFGDYVTPKSSLDGDDIPNEAPTFVATPRYYGSSYRYGRYRTTRSSYEDFTSRYRGSTRRYSDDLNGNSNFASSPKYYGRTYKYGKYGTTRSPYDDFTNMYRGSTRRYSGDTYKKQKASHLNTDKNKDFKNSSNLPYFDLTKSLDNKNETEIKNALSLNTNIYYSTDSLISNILNLSWVPRLINETISNDHDKSIDFCLMISFRIYNKGNIDWRYIQDVLSNPNKIHSSGEHDNLKLLRKHLCKVVLDFQIDKPNNEHYDSQKYLQKYQISFSKHAKKILATALGSETAVPVGVICTEHQVSRDNLLRERETNHADFQIISITFVPLLRMPLNFDLLEEHFLKILEELKRRSSDAEISRNSTNYDISFMLVWKGATNIRDIRNTPDFSELQTAQIKVFESKEKEYLNRFQNLVTMDFLYRYNRISIISGAQFNVRNFSTSWNKTDDPFKLEKILPYLHVQETNVSPCQLRHMLFRISIMFESLAVDEYTWNILINYYDQLSGFDAMNNETCKNIRSNATLPTNVMLFASNDIGKHWNNTGKVFENLLWDNPNIGKTNLTTVVFSALDVYWSTPKSVRSSYNYDESSTNYYGISKFVKMWKEANMSRIGFLVDISRVIREGNSHVDAIEKLSRTLCGPIFEEADVSVWEYKVYHNLPVPYTFTYGLEDDNLKVVLIKMLVAREMFLARYPEKEVIFSVNTDDLLENSKEYLKRCDYKAWSKDREFKWILFDWARINEVKIMFRPAYDLENPWYGYSFPPSSNGSEHYSSGC